MYNLHSKRFAGIILLLLVLTGSASAQYSDLDLKTSSTDQDSTLADYDNIFPFMGRKAVENGYRLPAPLGLNLNWFVANQNMDISNIQLGVNDSELVDVSGFITFEDIIADIENVNIRPDLWLFPFMNVYGILGYSQGTTTVKLTKPVPFTSHAEMKGPTYGAGMTFAFGLMGYFLVVDNNWTWSDMDILDEPTRSRIYGIRLGKNHRWREGKSIALWAGAMKIDINSNTQGRIKLAEVLPPLNPDQSETVQDWYGGLGLAQKRFVDETVAAASDAEVSYLLDKAPSASLSMVVGGQIELSRLWQIRAEFNISEDRKSLLANLVYRIDI
jgi:hypothetical protein